MVMDPNGPLIGYAWFEQLEAENARLKDEVAKYEEHNAALCERMQDLNGEVHTASCANANMHKENDRLNAEVERLRKAGDAMQKRLYVLENPTHPEVYLKLLSAWNAAKEGKQP